MTALELAPEPAARRRVTVPDSTGWLTRAYGAEFAEEWMRQRTTQYGFCGFGHPHSVRTIRCGSGCGQPQRTQLFCPTCESHAG